VSTGLTILGRLGYMALGAFLALFVVYSGDISKYRSASDRSEFTRRLGQGTYTNQLIECSDSLPLSDGDLESLRREVGEAVTDRKQEGKISSASVYFRYLNQGSWFGVGEDVAYIPASLLKVPTMIAFLKAGERDPALLRQKVLFDKKYDTNIQFVKNLPALEMGKEYTARELIEGMIRSSDNDALALLFLKVSSGIHDLDGIYKDLGVPFVANSTGPITAKQYSSFFRVLYNASYLQRDNSEYALRLLTETGFDKGLVAGVPADIVVAHKYGERMEGPGEEKYFHDCGIIYYPRNPYLLCVMTKGQDFEKLIATVRVISGIIYEAVSE
jgi:beta-lactamase class A